MLDWLVVGGGVQGTHLSLSLLRRNRVARNRLRVLDPHPEPLHAWRKRCAVTGMTHLRSPSLHHLGLRPVSLRRFGGTRPARGAFQFPHERPSLELFTRHCESLIHQHGLQELRLQGSARSMECLPDAVRIETAEGRLEARRVVLALGPSCLVWPDWAEEAARAGASVVHAFAPNFDRNSVPQEGELIVVGGGQSAIQLAMELAATRPGRVTLVARHEWRVNDFDFEPMWAESTALRRLNRFRCAKKRRQIVNRARRNGSVAPREYRAFRQMEERGEIHRKVGDAKTCRVTSDGIHLELHNDRDELRGDHVILATGFRRGPAMADWLSSGAERAGLARLPCGSPLVDPLLRWHPRLHVAGALAELEIGPTARNIFGARLAAERLSRVS